MPKTADRNAQSGIYRSSCCGYEIALSNGETFPPCRTCRKAVMWVLVRPTQTQK